MSKKTVVTADSQTTAPTTDGKTVKGGGQPRQPRDPSAKRSRLTPSTDLTLADVQGRVDGIVKPLQGLAMDATNKLSSAYEQQVALVALLSMPSRLAALNTEAKKTYGVKSAELKLVLAAATQAEADLNQLDLLDLKQTAQTYLSVKKVLDESTDVEARVTARSMIRALRATLRQTYNLAEECGYGELEQLVTTIETIDKLMADYGISEEGVEEPDLRATDVADAEALAKPVDCPFTLKEVPGLGDSETVVVLKKDESFRTPIFTGGGRRDFYNVEQLEGDKDSKSYLFEIKSLVDGLAVHLGGMECTRDGEDVIVKAKVMLGYMPNVAEDDNLVIIRASEVSPETVRAIRRSMGNDCFEQSVVDANKVLAFDGDVAVLTGELIKGKNPVAITLTKEDYDGVCTGQPVRQPETAPANGNTLADRVNEETAGKLKDLMSGSKTDAPTQTVAEAKAQAPAKGRSSDKLPTETLVQVEAPAVAKPLTNERLALANSGITRVTVPGESPHLATLEMAAGVVLKTGDFVSNLAKYGTTTRMSGGYRVEIGQPCLIVIGHDGDWLRRGEVFAETVLFARNCTESLIRSAQRIDIENSTVVMDRLEFLGAITAEIPRMDAFDLARYVRVAEGEILVVMESHDRQSQPVLRVAITTPVQLNAARREAGVASS